MPSSNLQTGSKDGKQDVFLSCITKPGVLFSVNPTILQVGIFLFPVYRGGADIFKGLRGLLKDK